LTKMTLSQIELHRNCGEERTKEERIGGGGVGEREQKQQRLEKEREINKKTRSIEGAVRDQWI